VELDALPDSSPPQLGLIDGYPYPIYGVRIDGERVRFHLELGDRYRDWCAEQRPRSRVEGTDEWGCSAEGMVRAANGCAVHVTTFSDAGPDGTTSLTSRYVAVECERISWCQALRERCFCKSTSCSARPLLRILFDATFRGDYADGTIIVTPGDAQSVRLKRARR
jgi:hypothetical protein